MEVVVQKFNEKYSDKSSEYTIQELAELLNVNDISKLKLQKSETEDWRKWEGWDFKNKTHWRYLYKNIEKVEVSNRGNVKINDKIIIDDDIIGKKSGYRSLKEYPALGLIYKLVAETFLIEDDSQSKDLGGWQVHHIIDNKSLIQDGKWTGDFVENLIYLRKDLHICKKGSVHNFSKNN